MEIGIKYETVIIHEIIDMLITESGHHGCVRKIVVCTCISNFEIWENFRSETIFYFQIDPAQLKNSI